MFVLFSGSSSGQKNGTPGIVGPPGTVGLPVGWVGRVGRVGRVGWVGTVGALGTVGTDGGKSHIFKIGSKWSPGGHERTYGMPFEHW